MLPAVPPWLVSRHAKPTSIYTCWLKSELRRARFLPRFQSVAAVPCEALCPRTLLYHRHVSLVCQQAVGTVKTELT